MDLGPIARSGHTFVTLIVNTSLSMFRAGRRLELSRKRLAVGPLARMLRSRETGLPMQFNRAPRNWAAALVAGAVITSNVAPALAQDRLPWLRDPPPAEKSYSSGGYNSGGVAQESLPPPVAAPSYSTAPRAGTQAYEGNDGAEREQSHQAPAQSESYSGARGFGGGDTYRPPAQADAYGGSRPYGRDDAYHPPASSGGYDGARPYARDDAYHPPARVEAYGGVRPYAQDDAYRPPGRFDAPLPPRYAEPYPPRLDQPEWRGDERGDRYGDRYASSEPPYYDREPPPNDGTFTMREIVGAGHGFFGSISQGLGSVIEYAFKTQGRPNGYILGEDLGGAFVAGLRYGEGRLFTRDAGTHKVYWQGPSLGYDAGAEGSKVMVLVYNLRDPSDIYQRFGGVAGSAYVVGGVGLTFQQRGDIVLAPIRAGVGLRIGANVGYLKYTRRPTWNPF